mgnify:CR=1 FL=1
MKDGISGSDKESRRFFRIRIRYEKTEILQKNKKIEKFC